MKLLKSAIHECCCKMSHQFDNTCAAFFLNVFIVHVFMMFSFACVLPIWPPFIIAFSKLVNLMTNVIRYGERL